jgi:hypothetical protein
VKRYEYKLFPLSYNTDRFWKRFTPGDYEETEIYLEFEEGVNNYLQKLAGEGWQVKVAMGENYLLLERELP